MSHFLNKQAYGLSKGTQGEGLRASVARRPDAQTMAVPATPDAFKCCIWHFVTPWTSPPGSSIHGVFQAGILEWVAISSCRESSQPRDQTRVSWVSCAGRRILYYVGRVGSPPHPAHGVFAPAAAGSLTGGLSKDSSHACHSFSRILRRAFQA